MMPAYFMKTLYIYISLLAILASVSGCKSIDLQQPENNGKVIMSIARTPCYGSCPTYEAVLYENGLLTYHGKRFTIKTGTFYAKVPKKEMDNVKKWFIEAGIFNFKDRYPEDDIAPTDLPSCKLYFRQGAKEKSIVDKNWNTPEPLTALENKIETWITIQNLQPYDK